MNIVKTRPEVHIAATPQLHIPASVENEIHYLHQMVGSQEWSGLLCCKVTGDIKKLQDLVVEVEHVYPCDIGSAAFTTYEPAEHMPEFWETMPDRYNFMKNTPWDGITCKDGYKLSQLHTHHSLSGGAYFSGVDMKDLHDNVEAHGLLISLIVAMDGRYVAKGAMLATASTTQKLSLTDFQQNMKIVTEEEVLVHFDFEVIHTVPTYLIDKVAVLIEEKKERERLAAITAKTKYFPPVHHTPHHNQSNKYGKHNKYGKGKPRQEQYLGDNQEILIPGFGIFYQDKATKIYRDESGAIIPKKDIEWYMAESEKDYGL